MATAKRVHTWRQRHPEEYLAYRKKRQLELRNIIDSAKDVPCADCSIRYPSYVMTFDHVRGVKSFSLGRVARYWSISLKKLLDVIAKCDVVCSNCHAIRTFSRRDDLYGGANGDEDTAS